LTWVLIGILITGSTEFDAYEIGRFDTMTSCFFEREQMLVKTEAWKGVPNINEQYVCIRTEYK